MTISFENAGARCVQILADLAKDIEEAGPGDVPHARFTADEDEIGSLPSSTSTQYTSLRDLIAVSPRAKRSKGGRSPMRSRETSDISEVKFKNNLLKLAAIAYLQPTGKRTSTQSHFYLAEVWESFNAKNVSLLLRIKAFFHRKAEACGRFFVAQATRIMKQLDPHQHLFRAISRNRSKSILPEILDTAGNRLP